MRLELKTSVYKDIPVIKVLGDVDHYTRNGLERTVNETLGAEGKRIALDLFDCPFMDSTGVSILFGLTRRVYPDGLLAIIGAAHNVLRVLDLVGIAQRANVHILSSLEELDGYLTAP
jgi:anti-anti-sigma factor